MGTDHYESASDLSSQEAGSSSTGQRRRPARSNAGTKAKKQKTQNNKPVVEAQSEGDMEEVVEEKEEEEQEEDDQEENSTAYAEHVHAILQLALPKGSIVTEDALERVSRAFGAIIKEVSASAAATVAGLSGSSTLHRTARQPLKKKGKASKSPQIKGAKPKKVEPLGEKYEVEAITDHHQTPAGRCRFLIKWKGYPLSDCTWEPLSALTGCQELLADYVKLHDITL